MKKNRITVLVIAALCMIISLFAFTACGSGSGTEAGEDDTRSATTEAADPADKFVGKWILAAAESQGITMAGDFGKMMGIEDEGMIKINEDGTGKISLGDDPVKLTWTQKSDDTITLKAEEETDAVEDEVDLVYKDESLRMTMEEDGKEGTAIFTHDGTYSEARIINMEEAQLITSEKELIGTWKLAGMNLYGISIYGDPEKLAEMSGGEDMKITFNEDGTADLNGEKGKWEVTEEGATLTFSDTSGDHKSPVKKLDDEIAIDMTDSFGGIEFITVLSKSK